ncbi:MAG TPA: ABC transporter permease [Pyrinomonadaceae bacterium]|nr:ABC transporter permease [Pyrinomonadaceae bacterium]
MESLLLKDLQYGMRTLTKRPGFFSVAVITLALGIGANTAVFSLVHSVLLRPLPFPEQEQLMMAWKKDTAANTAFVELSVAEIRDWQEQNQSFTALAAMPTTAYGYGYVLTGRGEPVQLESAKVTGRFFSLLGARAALGRVFVESDDQLSSPNVVVLSDRTWRERFGADPNIINQTITLNQQPFTVIGVMPADFTFPRGVDLWKPLMAGMNPQQAASRSVIYLQVVGRLKPGVTASQAEAELNSIISRVAHEHPETQATGHRVVLTPLANHLFGDARPALWALFAATGLLLLIAAANIANLLLARATSRRRELCVRAALGASRVQLVRQLLSESVVVAACGGALGVLLAYWLIELLVAIAPADIPRLEDVKLSGTALLISVLCIVLTTLIFGLLPALTASRVNLNETINEGNSRLVTSRQGNRLRAALVVGQIGLTVVMLAGAALLLQSFLNLKGVPLGFDRQNVLSMQLRLTGEKYRAVEARREFFRQLTERVEAHSGVDAAAGVLIRPLEGTVGWDYDYAVEGQSLPDARQNAISNFEIITPHYFRTFGIPLKTGRTFDPNDDSDKPPVAIISESMATRFFGTPDAAIGKRLKLAPDDPDEPWRSIVGVAGNVRYRELQGTRFDIYLPHAQSRANLNHFAVRTTLSSPDALALVRREVANLDSQLAVSSVATMNELMATQLARPRFNALLLNWLAALALLLAGLGVFGVMAYAVAQRTSELGLRIALGAQPQNIMTLVMRDGMKLAAFGLLLGLLSAFGLTRLLSSLLFGVGTTDPFSLIAITAVLSLVVMAACFIPARRATKVNPLEALRYE